MHPMNNGGRYAWVLLERQGAAPLTRKDPHNLTSAAARIVHRITSKALIAQCLYGLNAEIIGFLGASMLLNGDASKNLYLSMLLT